jgi:hypothetical protein
LLTDFKSGPIQNKRVLLAAVPHGHEPAGSAAIMNFIHAMLTGADLRGQPPALARARTLEQVVCLLFPAGAADGFARSPILYWDGTRASDDYYHDLASGVLKDGRRFGRALREWSDADHDVEHPGLHYEETAEGEWVEPHISKRGTLWRLMRPILDEYPPDFFLNMHQGGTGRATCGFGETPEPDPIDAHIKMPTDDWIPDASQAMGRRMAKRLWDKWEAGGVRAANRLFGYASKPDSWRADGGRGERFRWMMDWIPELYGAGYLTLEVTVNNPRSPVDKQLEAGTLALAASAEGLVEEEKIAHAPKE